jgi:hypothetical protein
MVKNITHSVVAMIMALTLVFSFFSFSPVSSVTTSAANYGGDIPCDQYKTPEKRLKCLEKLKKNYEKQLKKAYKNKDWATYNQLLSDINNTYWEIWNVLTYWWDYF